MSYKYAIGHHLDDTLEKKLQEELSLTPEQFHEKCFSKINESDGFTEDELRLISSIIGLSAFELFTKEAIEYFYEKEKKTGV